MESLAARDGGSGPWRPMASRSVGPLTSSITT